jgi:hypothetical protein
MTRKVLLSVATIMMVSTMMLVNFGTVLASDSQASPDKGRALFGTVESVVVDDGGNATALILVNPDNEVAVNADTLYRFPEGTDAWQAWGEAVAEAVAEGVRVAVLLDEEKTVAERVMALQNTARFRHRVGVVTEAEGDCLRMVNREGAEVCVDCPQGIPEEVTPGQYMTMVTERKADENNGQCVAVHNMEQLITRLQKGLEDAGQEQIEQAEALLEESCDKAIKALERIQNRVENHVCEQSGEQSGDPVEAQVRDREQAMNCIHQALEQVQTCYQQALQNMQQTMQSTGDGLEGE